MRKGLLSPLCNLLQCPAVFYFGRFKEISIITAHFMGKKSPLAVRKEMHFGLLPLRHLGASEDANIPWEQRAAEDRDTFTQAVLSSRDNISGACRCLLPFAAHPSKCLEFEEGGSLRENFVWWIMFNEATWGCLQLHRVHESFKHYLLMNQQCSFSSQSQCEYRCRDRMLMLSWLHCKK